MSSHMLFGRQLSRDTEHRIAMRRNLVQSLFEHGKVRTTLPKALEVRAMAEKLITLARKNTLTARRRVIAQLQDRRLTDKDQEFTGRGHLGAAYYRCRDEVLAPLHVCLREPSGSFNAVRSHHHVDGADG